VDHHQQPEDGRYVGYTVHEYGYDVTVYEEGGAIIESYNAGNSRWESTTYVERGDPARLSKTVLKRYAKQTATEMAGSHGIDPSRIFQEEEEG
jgi:hypothetical protein